MGGGMDYKEIKSAYNMAIDSKLKKLEEYAIEEYGRGVYDKSN